MNTSPCPVPSDPETAGDVIALYLHNTRKDADPRAFADRELVLRRFKAAHGHLPLAKCKPHHLRLWVDVCEKWKSDWTIKRVISTVHRCFNWAAKLGMIDRNPFWGVSHRQGEPGRPMEREEFAQLLRGTDALFRRVLIFLRFTGCRPGEMAAAEWHHLDLGRGVIVLHKHKTSRTQRTPQPRIIVLHPVALKLLIWLRKRLLPDQTHLFINAKGAAWTRYALSCRIKRLRKDCGLAGGCKLYGLRHAFGTDAILRGTELKTLSVLMGHRSTRTTEHYTHIAGKTDHLRKALEGIFPASKRG